MCAASFAQTPQWQWARSGVGNEYDEALAVATDPYGFIVVAGYFGSDSITFGNITLHNNTPGFTDLFLVKYNAAGNVVWARSAGGAFDDQATAVFVDASANIHLTGNFYSSTIVFGTDTLANAGNVGDILVVKYDANGNFLRARRDGGPGLEIPYAIVVDDAGNSYVAGRFSSNSITFGSTTLLQAGSMDVFVVKYDALGEVVWAQGAGGGSNDEAYALSVDSDGDLIVGGYYTQEADFGPFTLANPGLGNVFLARCDGATGTFEWARGFGSDGDERALSIALDPADNIYAVGYFQSDSLMFGATTLHASSTDNGFIARFDEDGDPAWAQGLNGRSKVQGVVVRYNAAFACGTFRNDNLNYGSSELTLQGGSDLFLVKTDLDGAPQWAAKQTAGGESGETANALALHPTGALVMAGAFNSDIVEFGAAQLTNSDGYDMFVLSTGDDVIGVPEPPVPSSLLVFPNPAATFLSIRWATAPPDGATLRITDASGRIFLEPVRWNGGEFTLPIAHLPAGSYTVELRDDRGERIASAPFVRSW